MANTNEDPVRRNAAWPYKRTELPIRRAVPLPQLSLTSSFDTALHRRRSADVFGPISAAELGTLLKFTAGVQATNLTDSNRQRRYVASFGALHPAHILVGTTSNVWSAYLPDRHALGLLDTDANAASVLRQQAEACHPGADAILIALLADLDLADSYYINPYQLLLRDAGVFFGHASLVAAAIDLPFRILGTVASPSAERLIPALSFRSGGTGLAWVGGSKTEVPAAETGHRDQIDSLLGVD